MAIMATNILSATYTLDMYEGDFWEYRLVKINWNIK